MNECEYCVDEICVNADCPLVADFCPVSDSPNECYYSETTEDAEDRNDDRSVWWYLECPDCGFKYSVYVSPKTSDEDKKEFTKCPCGSEMKIAREVVNRYV